MRVKIIKSPAFPEGLYAANYFFPPLALSRIYAYLHERNFNISQDDISLSSQPLSIAVNEAVGKVLKSFIHKKKELIVTLQNCDLKFVREVLKFYKLDVANVDVLLVSIYECDIKSAVMGLFIAKYFKLINPSGVVVVGGEWGLNAFIGESFENCNKAGLVDYCIVGSGEMSIEMLLNFLKGNSISLETIPGLVYRGFDGCVRRNAHYTQRPFLPLFDGLDLSKYTWRYFGFFRKYDKKRFTKSDITVLPIQSISGCINNCAFCGYSDIACEALPAEQAAENILFLAKKYNVEFFYFLDSTINISEKYITAFCERLLKADSKVSWSSCASFRGLDNPDIFKLMRRAGACRLIYGLESGSQRILKQINKNVDLDCVAQGLKWSSQAGIWNELEIIAGLPHEKKEDVDLTIRFLKNNQEYIDKVWLNRFFLDNGSYMYLYPEQYGLERIWRSSEVENAPTGEFARYAYYFDELNGLMWNDKKEQIEKSFLTVRKFLNDNNMLASGMLGDEQVLFYLYKKLSSKQEIHKYYDLYRSYWLGNKHSSRIRNKFLWLVRDLIVQYCLRNSFKTGTKYD